MSNEATPFDGARILVTGGTGSLGQVLVRRILAGELGSPQKVIVLSRDEAKQHEMRMAYLHRTVSTDEVIYENFERVLEFRVGDVRDPADVLAAVRDSDIVFNASALKQVPTCEYFPYQAVLTNCMGAQNIVNAVSDPGSQVHTVIGISTDKACKPVNVMGMTKSIQERIFVAANINVPDTRFIGVRYGNVMASRGSVIPLFLRQIENCGPVTVTVPDMTRFLLSIEQAVDTVFMAVQEARRGEIYLPRVASATVVNIARALIGERDIPLEILGARPGEKMHEIMVSEEECRHVADRGNYYAIQPMLPELRCETENLSPLEKEYSSADEVLDLTGTRSLLEQHDLTGEDARGATGGELLR